MLTPLAGLAGAAAVCTVVWIGDPTTPGGFLPPCPTRLLLHIDCPGCGSTRALYSLVHGDVPVALGYNALGVVAFVLIAIAFVMYTVGLWRGRRIRSLRHRRLALVIGLAVVTVWFVIRNIPVEPFAGLKV
ncbi:DUF2752 domain-containing protein [Gordonia neofelifaecis]|uniref:DUF2752 domain-containing protein n=1 Tax=Gordonia neofelifaecis NRRL B-59395 TaxID=644548 RepID=F1YMZ2_9ACTN|nr:DUF2752 domain-containing protein [Gordonia neofelifaecis]EGD53879.1 hypothetical protein SCNU_16498 [Gordonia neofelifaecis NRRL B-59395]